MIYKEAKTRLCRASGIDRRFISVQIGFHGQLEGTDASRGDWHPLCIASLNAVFDWQTLGNGRENMQINLEYVYEADIVFPTNPRKRLRLKHKFCLIYNL